MGKASIDSSLGETKHFPLAIPKLKGEMFPTEYCSFRDQVDFGLILGKRPSGLVMFYIQLNIDVMFLRKGHGGGLTEGEYKTSGKL
ncbi:hypothetical protein Tco_0734461 [Tanacetum coccineum]